MSTVIDLTNLMRKKSDIAKLSDPVSMERIGVKVLEMNQAQIKRGVDEDDKKFKPYSESYQKHIMDAKSKTKTSKKTGKSYWGGSGPSKARLGAKDPGNVNLTVTGAMLADFGVVRVERGEVEVGFHSLAGSKGKPSPKEKAEWNVKLRHFVGLTPKNERALFEWIHRTFFGRH